MRFLKDAICAVERVIGSFILFGMLVLLSISVGSRYIFKKPITWTDELSTYLFVLMTFLGASYSVSKSGELIVNVLYERFEGARRFFDYLLHFVRLIISSTLIYSGYRYFLAERALKVLSPLCQIPYHFIAALVPLFGALLFIKSIIGIYELKAR